MSAYRDFCARLKLLISKNPQLITTTLSNIFTMRLVGNKTHGDLAEIGIAEFINQYMYDFRSIHVGKDLYRAKEHEEDIKIINEITKAEFTVSLKAYGDGPLQLSTDKNFQMFPVLKDLGKLINKRDDLDGAWKHLAFSTFGNLNVLPLIYDEKRKRCNIMVFKAEDAMQRTAKICYEESGKGRTHPVFRFYDAEDSYICEVRYGSGTANALQRGLWTNTKNATKYFDSVTSGWIDYSHNLILVKLLSHALLGTAKGHERALIELQKDIEEQKTKAQLQ